MWAQASSLIQFLKMNTKRRWRKHGRCSMRWAFPNRRSAKCSNRIHDAMADSGLELDRESCLALASVLRDSPHTCIARHALTTGRGRGFAIGPPSALRAAIVHPDVTPGELLAFGEDVGAICELLGTIPRWKCVEVAPEIA